MAHSASMPGALGPTRPLAPSPLSMSLSTCPRQSAARPSIFLSRLAAWIHHLRRLTTGVPFATTCARNGSQLRRCLQDDRTKWKRCCCQQPRSCPLSEFAQHQQAFFDSSQSPMSWDFIPSFHILAPLSRASCITTIVDAHGKKLS